LETEYFINSHAALIILSSVPTNIIFTAGISVLLLLLATLIAGVEVSVLALSPSSIDNIEAQNNRKSKIITGFCKDPERLHLTVSIATTIIYVVIFLLNTPLFHYLFIELGLNTFSLICITFLFALILLIFSELLPRLFFSIAERYLNWAVIPVKVVEALLSPITLIILEITNEYSKRYLGSKHHISIQDISEALELTTDSLSNEGDILKGLVNFGNIDVQKILRPRIDVVAVEKDIDSGELFDLVIESGYSRIPVFSETFDNIVGILYVKDLLPHFKEFDHFNWQPLIREPYFVPETKKVKELLSEFQSKKIHMAVIIDEYGGATGIVTLDDILEEIVGEIGDESDEDEQTFTQLDDKTYIFEGVTLLSDFYSITNCDDTIFDEVRGEADTLAGLILELKGEIPDNGDEIEFEPFLFIIELVDNQRIKQVRVIITNAEEPEND
jgi:gliding motility-associated protein GldE